MKDKTGELRKVWDLEWRMLHDGSYEAKWFGQSVSIWKDSAVEWVGRIFIAEHIDDIKVITRKPEDCAEDLKAKVRTVVEELLESLGGDEDVD